MPLVFLRVHIPEILTRRNNRNVGAVDASNDIREPGYITNVHVADVKEASDEESKHASELMQRVKRTSSCITGLPCQT